MSRDPWDLEVRPTCPEACRWRTVCTTWLQEGIRPLWDAGKITSPAQCPYYGHRELVHANAEAAAAARRASSEGGPA